jgi:hypothetical protein
VCSPCITIQEKDTQYLLVGLGPPRSEHRQYPFGFLVYFVSEKLLCQHRRPAWLWVIVAALVIGTIRLWSCYSVRLLGTYRSSTRLARTVCLHYAGMCRTIS